MNILHYSLGFPPFRRGGMTQYCLDLMVEQVKAGHKSALLWPGRLRDLSKKSKIEKKQNYNLQNDLFCESYELFNPLPIPLMDGIRKPEMYLAEKEKEPYRRFFQNNTFDVLHIHTFMGLPAEVIEVAQDAGVMTVFTSHDYFPFCPRCNFFHAGKDCIDDHDGKDCVGCNQYGLSLAKMKFFQSVLYRSIKGNSFIKVLRAKHNRKMYDVTEQAVEKEIIDIDCQTTYQTLRQKNIELLETLDAIHFNSISTLCRYQERGYSGRNAKVISISNGAIRNYKEIREPHDPLRFGYLGPVTTHKGYNLFRTACDMLWQGGMKRFEAHVFVQIENAPDYMVCHAPYHYSELKAAMESFDILVAPSVCVETFGFTVLEALSYGIPVIVTDCVGAAELIENGKNGFVIQTDPGELAHIMKQLLRNRELLKGLNKYIVDSVRIKLMDEHSIEIEQLYHYYKKV